jgi:hypothetical protein
MAMVAAAAIGIVVTTQQLKLGTTREPLARSWLHIRAAEARAVQTKWIASRQMAAIATSFTTPAWAMKMRATSAVTRAMATVDGVRPVVRPGKPAAAFAAMPPIPSAAWMVDVKPVATLVAGAVRMKAAKEVRVAMVAFVLLKTAAARRLLGNVYRVLVRTAEAAPKSAARALVEASLRALMVTARLAVRWVSAAARVKLVEMAWAARKAASASHAAERTSPAAVAILSATLPTWPVRPRVGMTHGYAGPVVTMAKSAARQELQAPLTMSAKRACALLRTHQAEWSASVAPTVVTPSRTVATCLVPSTLVAPT